MDNQVFDLLLQGQADQKDAIDDLKRVVEDGFKSMNGRVRTTESELAKVKTALALFGSVSTLVFGWLITHWGGFRLWLITP